jgi:hypothetical protein
LIETQRHEVAFFDNALDVFAHALYAVEAAATFNRQLAHNFTFLKPEQSAQPGRCHPDILPDFVFVAHHRTSFDEDRTLVRQDCLLLKCLGFFSEADHGRHDRPRNQKGLHKERTGLLNMGRQMPTHKAIPNFGAPTPSL